jgi:radical SAM protein with 4Fe4S-binding SPASM domain
MVGQEMKCVPSKKEYKLEHVDIELTKQCNLNCIHCSARLEELANKELTFDEIASLLREAKSLGLKSVGLTGGEPFRRRVKLSKVMDFCRNEIGVPVHIHTNGILINDEDAAGICRDFEEITIALYGSDPETHDFITQVPGSMELTWKALSRLQNARANVTIYLVPMKYNQAEIVPILNKVYDKGFKKIRILSLSPTGRARERFNELALNKDELSNLNREIEKAQEKIGVELYAGFYTRQYYPKLRMLPDHDSCLAAENRMHVNSFGIIFPCTASSGRMIFSAGDLRNKGYTLSELWNSSLLFQFIRNFHSNPPNKCQSCGLHERCMSGCRVMMFHKYGDATIADPQCLGPIHM